MRSLPAALALGLAVGCVSPPAEKLLEDARLKMGTRFEIRLVAGDEAAGRQAIDEAFAEIDRVEASLSEWRDTSEISELNRGAGGRAAAVGGDLLAVLQQARRVSELTGGAFDVTYAACGGLWSFDEPRLPSEADLRRCLQDVDYRRIELDPEASTARLPEGGMRVGISGIGKGYGVDRAAAVLEARGFDRYIVDGGGDIRLSGRAVDRPWVVGIAHPRRAGELYGSLSLDGGAVVTSGDYFKSFELDGIRYHHILDPRTGRPARLSAATTVIAPTAVEADALATGLFVLGPDAGLALVERLTGVEALFFDVDLQVRRSSGFPDNSDPRAPRSSLPSPTDPSILPTGVDHEPGTDREAGGEGTR